MPDSMRLPALARPDALTAAAISYTPDQWRSANLSVNTLTWQQEAWNFRRTLGEFNQAMDWMARAMSRVRLAAAEVVPGGDEPELLTEGPAADLMESFCGGPPGHSAFLKAITPQLQIPGEGWLIAERQDPSVPLANADWGVYSSECVTALSGLFRVRVGWSQWRDLESDALPMRIYEPDPQYPWLATSNAEAAVPIMRRIYLIDSRIVAMMVSRLAMNGLLLIPQEGTFSVPSQYMDAPDPFVAMLIDTAARNIANPGQASAAIPLPVKFTGDLIKQWQLLKPDDSLDEWLLKERVDELGRLGDTIGIARERVTGGMGKQNHWGAWQASEEEVRITFAPLSETICGGITKAYLVPMLQASGQSLVGPHGGRLISWYDPSELTTRPDLAGPAKDLYDRLEISGTAYRRETGFSEADAPTPPELETMVWKKVAGTPQLAPTSASELGGHGSPTPDAAGFPPGAAPGGSNAVSPAAEATPAASGPPQTQAVPPPAPGAPPAQTASAAIAAVLEQAGRLGDRPRNYGGAHRVNGSRSK